MFVSWQQSGNRNDVRDFSGGTRSYVSAALVSPISMPDRLRCVSSSDGTRSRFSMFAPRSSQESLSRAGLPHAGFVPRSQRRDIRVYQPQTRLRSPGAEGCRPNFSAACVEVCPEGAPTGVPPRHRSFTHRFHGRASQMTLVDCFGSETQTGSEAILPGASTAPDNVARGRPRNAARALRRRLQPWER